MRFIGTIIMSLIVFGVNAQSSLNMNLVYQWQDNGLVSSSAHDNTYNEIWGYANNGREYAIIGTTAGTHIFDITDVNNVDTVYFIPGKAQGSNIIHRDYDTYQDYLYIVADEGASSLQIADLSFLPDSAPVVYDEDSLIIHSHNIFIDTTSGYLYTCGGATNFGPNKLSIYGLSSDPTDPQFLLNAEFDVPFWNATIGYLHDIYVRNDTAYCNAGNNGFFVVDFSNLSNVVGLGSLTTYMHQGYNHSGWLHSSGDYYALADENHGLRVKILDVSNLANINVIDTTASNVDDALSIPHNLIFRGDNLYASYYFDGLYVFNTADPNNVSLAGYYDTSTRTHDGTKYEGNWGVYPLLPSGKILASDMQEGLFVFEVTFPTGVNTPVNDELDFIVYPNPANDVITVTTTVFKGSQSYVIANVNGAIVQQGDLTQTQTSISLGDMASGFYSFSIVKDNGARVTKKFIKK